ncbi:MAG: carboxypeptidase-like regulatory domain-containing protein [Bacteroidales bacterium]|nr:carboxypeptidase-like regulatory domain-containing protein [Bacteroidales bacterium]
MKTTILMAILMGVSICLSAQNGAIHGKIIDEYGEPMYAVNVNVIDAASPMGATTDFDGNFKIKPLDAGTYTLVISYVGYTDIRIMDIKVYNNKITFIKDTEIKVAPYVLDGDYTVIGWTEPIVNKDEPSKITVSNDIIIRTPASKNPAMLARAYQSDVQVVGNQMVVRGSRPGSSSVYIDGMKVKDEMSGLPSMAIGSLEIYTGGIPAKYGDVTGGVVMMTTKSYFDILNERKAAESRR